MNEFQKAIIDMAFHQKHTPAPVKSSMVTKIVVLQRGWVLVGKYSREGDECLLLDSSVIRRWGTTKGLGELAINGPLKDTILEPAGTCRFHRGAEVLVLDCEESKWLKS